MSWRLYNVSIWSVAISLNKLFRSFFVFEGFNYVLPWKFSNYASIIFVVSVFILEIVCDLHIAVSVSSVIASSIVRHNSSTS